LRRHFVHCTFCRSYPCRCLCLGFEVQITRTTPLRWMTLHLSQIFFTDARTFITQPSAVSDQPTANQKSFVPIHNSPAIQVVGRKLHRDLVPWQNADEVLAHLARNVSQHLVFVLQFHPEHGIRQRFQNHRHHFNRVFFAHRLLGKLLALSFWPLAKSQEPEANSAFTASKSLARLSSPLRNARSAR